MTPRIVPIIMAGGAGTRLWPVSRDSMPKQFISLLTGERSTFEATLQRLSGPDFDRPIVVTSDAFRFICAEQIRAAGVQADIVLEPERRDSAAAVAVGALLAARRDPAAVCVVLASRSRHSRFCRFRRRLPPRCHACRGRDRHDARHSADAALHRLWLHRTGRGPGR